MLNNFKQPNFVPGQMLDGQVLHREMLHGQMLHGQMLRGQMLHGQMVLGRLSTVKDGPTNLKCPPRKVPNGILSVYRIIGFPNNIYIQD